MLYLDRSSIVGVPTATSLSGMLASLARCASIRAMLPPALTPPIDMRAGSMLNFAAPAGEEIYLRASKESRIPVGYACSGTRR